MQIQSMTRRHAAFKQFALAAVQHPNTLIFLEWPNERIFRNRRKQRHSKITFTTYAQTVRAVDSPSRGRRPHNFHYLLHLKFHLVGPWLLDAWTVRGEYLQAATDITFTTYSLAQPTQYFCSALFLQCSGFSGNWDVSFKS